MRKRRTTTRSLITGLGLALVVTSGALVVTAIPSWAAVGVVPATGPVAGTNKIVISGGATAMTSASVAEFSTTACLSVYMAPASGTVISAGVVVPANPATGATITVPALAAATSYYVCVYAGTGGTSALQAGTAGAAYTTTAASLTSLTASPTSAAAAANVTVTDTATAFSTGTTIELTTSSCATTYTAAGTGIVSVVPAVFTPGATSVTFAVPAGLSQTSMYYICAYTGSTASTSALITRTTAASFSLPQLVLSPAKGPTLGTNTVTATDATASFSGSTTVEFSTTVCAATYTATSGTTVAAGTVTGFTTTTLTVVVPLLAAATPYYVCAYNGSAPGAGGSGIASGMAATGYATVAIGALTLLPTRGTSDGGEHITATSAPTGIFGATIRIEFQTQACSATYATPAAGTIIAGSATSTDGTTLNITMPPLPANTYSICAYTGTGGANALLAKSATRAYSVFGVLTLSTANGPDAGGNSITATTSSGTFLTGNSVVFVLSDPLTPSTLVCPMTRGTPGGTFVATNLRILSAAKIAFMVPAAVTIAGGSTYNVCAYSGSINTSTLISGTIDVYTVDHQAVINSVTPTAGSAQGGTLITVAGNYLAGITDASVGGLPLEDVTEINNGTAFTAHTPAHVAGGPFPITVTTSGGTTTKVGAFSYAYGIVVTPNYTPNTQLSGVDVDISGIGFSALTFTPGALPNSTDAHIYLVPGTYSPTGSTTKAVPEISECVSVLPISDTELICTMNLASTLTNATAPVTDTAIAHVVADATGLTSGGTLTSAGGHFTQADVGMLVSETTGTASIASPIAITAVSTDGITATLGGSLTSTALTSGGVTVAAARAFATATQVSGTTLITKTGAFGTYDIGRSVTGTGIPMGTVITDATANTITLSQPTTSSAAAGSIGNSIPVPVGTYTVTVVSNGGIGVTYTASVVSSGSTFTVSEF